MNEHNRSTLHEAIQGLPQHSPAPELWDRISAQLSVPETEIHREHLQAALDQLPVHRAPARVWTYIRQALPAPVRVRASWVAGLGVAAAACLLLWFSPWTQAPPAPVPVHEKQLPDPGLLPDAEAADYRTRMEWEEQTLRACLEQNHPAIQDAAQALDRIAVLRDSLTLQPAQPLTTAQLQRLEDRRSQLIQELRRHCP